MVWKRAFDDDGFSEIFPPAGTWMWIWGPKFPFVLRGILKEIDDNAFWFGENDSKIHAALVTHWFDGPRDKAGRLIGGAPDPPATI